MTCYQVWVWLAITSRFENLALIHQKWACPPRCALDRWATFYSMSRDLKYFSLVQTNHELWLSADNRCSSLPWTSSLGNSTTACGHFAIALSPWTRSACNQPTTKKEVNVRQRKGNLCQRKRITCTKKNPTMNWAIHENAWMLMFFCVSEGQKDLQQWVK